MENKQITVADLGLLRNIIDLASTRGAFRASEMKDVGEVYNKLSDFLEAVVAQAEAQSKEETPSEEKTSDSIKGE